LWYCSTTKVQSAADCLAWADSQSYLDDLGRVEFQWVFNLCGERCDWAIRLSRQRCQRRPHGRRVDGWQVALENNDNIVFSFRIHQTRRGESPIRTTWKRCVGQDSIGAQIPDNINDLLVPTGDDDRSHVSFDCSVPDVSNHRLPVDVRQSFAREPCRARRVGITTSGRIEILLQSDVRILVYAAATGTMGRSGGSRTKGDPK
jgi:hypothetical protein